MPMDWEAVRDMERDVNENAEMYEALADADTDSADSDPNSNLDPNPDSDSGLGRRF